MSRVDASVAAGFVGAAVVEAVVLNDGASGLFLMHCAGAPVLAVLAFRRHRPVLVVVVIALFAVLGTALQTLLWPGATDNGGVWMFALLLACYSLGAWSSGPGLVLGFAAPLMVVTSVDAPALSGWEMLNGIVFVTLFVGVLPTAVGAAVRRRREALLEFARQRAALVEANRKERATAVLQERLRNTERFRPALLDGLRELASKADSATDVSVIESSARTLLGRTRHEVLALTAPVPVPEAIPHPLEPDERAHLTVLRSAGQPWAALVAGALGAALAVESLESLPLSAPDWIAVCAAFVVAAPLALLPWRPLAAVVLTWIGVALFSTTVAPLDASLSGSGIALVLAFSVAVLSTRATAVAGLLVCWLGAGLQTADPLGVSAILLAAWLGGIAVNEVTDLVEQSREHNRHLVLRARSEAQHAVVEERMRIAREVHDVLGHSLTVIAIQAGAARRLEATDPERAATARRTLGAAAREGLRILDESGPRTPDLEATLERTRNAGLPVEAEVDDLTGIDTVTLHAAERVVQESLTNVLRHAPGSRATVRVSLAGDRLDIVVTNTAPTSPGSGPGSNRGLAGMRERVTNLAGQVTWGPDPQGGFTVDAQLPVSRLAATGANRR